MIKYIILELPVLNMSSTQYLCYNCFNNLCKVSNSDKKYLFTTHPWTCNLCEVNYQNIDHLQYICYCGKDSIVNNQNIINVYICKSCTDCKKFTKFEKKKHDHEWCLHPECIESDKEFMNKYQLECHYRNEH